MSSNINEERSQRLAEHFYSAGAAAPVPPPATETGSSADLEGPVNWYNECARKRIGFESQAARADGLDVNALREAVREKPATASSTLEDLERLFLISERGRVQEFLASHSYLFPLILEAFTNIDEVFALTQKCSLEITEIDEEDSAKLLLAINVSETDVEAVDRLYQLKKWWLPAKKRAHYRMVIDLRFN